ncbi:PQQ-binding-like beta-propeller repeat protein [Streptomyces sp. NRRL S-350]|uniref:PQQ-binding-like beta-propeller repeat protein n=1 Tax=Streptomyces sp. NRRL S-350 TaxID=1463902 RepID=UPI00131B702F|nr:PQQ-binding-like beta-propeller repeat protein [Streptomyces sp. NRRL S-350]
MTSPLRVLRVLGERPFAEAGEPALAVSDEECGLLAVAGEPGFAQNATVAVYDTGDLGCLAVLRTRFPVQALAFHPTEPLLAVGTGEYDGGYFFEGELLLLDWETGAARSLIEGDLGRQVLGLTWLDGQALQVLMAPYDDYKDERTAHVEGHVAVVRRPDWHTVTPHSLTPSDLAGPRVPAPRPDGRDEARSALSALSPDWEPRHQVRAIEELPDGGLLATLHKEEDAPDRPVPGDREDGLLIRYRTTAYVERQDRLRIRRGSRDYVRQAARARRRPNQDWLAARSSKGPGTQLLFPLSWEPGQTHFPGPGAETSDGDLVYVGTVYDGRGLQPGGSFVVRRAAADGAPRWIFWTDHVATDLDTAADTAFVTYRNGELLALDLYDGTLRWRHQVTAAGIPAVPTALTATEPGHLLIGTSDGRILDCTVV